MVQKYNEKWGWFLIVKKYQNGDLSEKKKKEIFSYKLIDVLVDLSADAELQHIKDYYAKKNSNPNLITR